MPSNPLPPSSSSARASWRKLLERLLEIDARPLGEFLQPLLHATRNRRAGPRPPSSSGLEGSTITLRRIERPRAAQPVALLAGAVRAVEGERPRLQLRNAGAALRAGQLLRIQPLLAVHHRNQHQPVGQLGRRLDGSFQALFDTRLHQQPVHHHLDGVVLALVQRNVFVERAQHAVDARAHEALARELLQILLVLAFAAAHHRRHAP